MEKVVIESIRIKTSQRFKREDVVTATINNYSSETIFFTHKGVQRSLPPVHSDLNVPVAPFPFEVAGHSFDLDITIDFPLGIGDVIIDYSTNPIKNC